MSELIKSTFKGKLTELTQSRRSIKNLSEWVIHHREYHDGLVKIWYQEFLKAQENRKLLFIYLANDVIQASKLEGGEFGNTFLPLLKKTFDQMARIPAKETQIGMLEVFKTWEDRRVYEVNLVRDFESRYLEAWNDLREVEFQELLNDNGVKIIPLERSTSTTKPKDKSHNKDDRKDNHSSPTSSGSGEAPQKRSRSKKEDIETKLGKRSMKAANVIEKLEVDGVKPPSPYKEPLTEDDFIQMIQDMDAMPSIDAATRVKIANLPPEVCDMSVVDEVCIDSKTSRVVQRKIKDAAALLHDYNGKLDLELVDRKKASMKLKDFVHSQKDLLTQAEHRLEEHQNHLKILQEKFEFMKSHVLSMPDMTKLPSAQGGLAPLPSAAELFNS